MSSPPLDPSIGRAASPLGDALGPIDEAFHAGYADARDAAAQDGPVLVLLGDELTLVDGDYAGGSAVRNISPDLFHALKAIAHLPVALFVMLQRGGSPEALPRLRARATQAMADVDTLSTGAADARAVLDGSCAFIDAVLAGAPAGADDRDARLRALATELGPPLLRLIDEGTRAQLAALHRAVTELLEGLDERRRAALHVVVAGAHQARARSLGMQYFRRVLDEPDGVEGRVTYAEAVESVQEAVRLVGVQRLDREMARAFFGDETRLQRDVLGDAARGILETTDLGG